MQPVYPQIQLNVPSPRAALGRIVQKILNIVLFVVISSVALLVALGYKPNLAAQSIEPTGILELDSANNVSAVVSINGVKEEGGLPFQKRWIPAGEISVKVEKPGYQTWSHIVDIEENMRSRFPDILLIYTTPQSVALPTLGANAYTPSASDLADIESTNGELRIKKVFVTRYSGEIISARWFPDRNHLVLQFGTSLYLADLDGTNLQLLATVSAPQTIAYTFQDGGRILIYQDGSVPKAVALFEPSSLIERLGSGQ